MPYRSTPIEQTYPSLAARKRRSAERREMQAAVMRGEAADYERRWREYCATRDAAAVAEIRRRLAADDDATENPVQH